MKTVAIISEYNPFHTGHKYQIDSIRAEFGEDTRIIAIMSGNFTQRGELAITDKYTRAECAVRAGVNLVLELPFPYSASSAEFFATSGVSIANSLGCVDYLSFGSEFGNIEELLLVASRMDTKEYKTSLREFIDAAENKDVGFPRAAYTVYKNLYSEDITREYFSPNNILAFEYIKAIKKLNSKIIPHTIKRNGAGYTDTKISEIEHQSAGAIRKIIETDFESALSFVPDSSKDTLIRAYNEKRLPADADKISSAIISHLRINSPKQNIHDAGGGLYNRIRSASFDATNFTSLIKLAETKKYTQARIRRVCLYSLLGVTSSAVRELPEYTQVLAMDTSGQAILKSIKKVNGIRVITKPSDSKFSTDAQKAQKELSDMADSIYTLSLPCPTSGNAFLKATPYILR